MRTKINLEYREVFIDGCSFFRIEDLGTDNSVLEDLPEEFYKDTPFFVIDVLEDCVDTVFTHGAGGQTMSTCLLVAPTQLDPVSMEITNPYILQVGNIYEKEQLEKIFKDIDACMKRLELIRCGGVLKEEPKIEGGKLSKKEFSCI